MNNKKELNKFVGRDKLCHLQTFDLNVITLIMVSLYLTFLRLDT